MMSSKRVPLLPLCTLTLSFLQMLESGMAPSLLSGSLQMSPSDQKSSTWGRCQGRQ